MCLMLSSSKREELFVSLLQVAALTVLLAWTGLVRGTSEDVAMEKSIGC